VSILCKHEVNGSSALDCYSSEYSGVFDFPFLHMLAPDIWRLCRRWQSSHEQLSICQKLQEQQ